MSDGVAPQATERDDPGRTARVALLCWLFALPGAALDPPDPPADEALQTERRPATIR